jgi:hypothetical protein
VPGAKVTDTVQLFPAANEVPHVFVWPKPYVVVMLVMLNALEPLFVRVAVWGGLVTPMVTLPKLSDEVESLTAVDGTIIERREVRVMLPVFARTITIYVPAAVVAGVLIVKVEVPDSGKLEGLNVAVAPGIEDRSTHRFTVPVRPPRL